MQNINKNPFFLLFYLVISYKQKKVLQGNPKEAQKFQGQKSQITKLLEFFDKINHHLVHCPELNIEEDNKKLSNHLTSNQS